MLKILKWFLVAAIILFAIYHLRGKFAELITLKSLLTGISWWWFAAACLGELGSYVFDGLLSQHLIKVTGKALSFIDSFRIAIIDVFASQVVPVGQAGSSLMAASFYKKMGVENGAIIFLVVYWAVLTFAALFTMFFIGWSTLPVHPRFLPVINYWVWIIIPVVILVIYKIGKPFITKKFGDLNLKSALVENSKKILKNKINFLVCILSAIGYYISLSLVLYGSILAFGGHINFQTAIFALTAAQIVRALALVPGGIGAVESVLLVVLSGFGIAFPIVFAGSMLYRVIDFWIPMIFGSISFYYLSKNKQVFAKAHRE